jgi:chemotaxis protein histidine kinase CheA
MGGSIEVRSQRGVGTSFTIDIPIAEARRRPVDFTASAQTLANPARAA